MAELSTRDLFEKAFATRLGKLSMRHRRQVESALGSPPRFDNVPQSVWDQIRKETQEESAAMMLLIFLASAEEHGYSGPDAAIAGEGYAAQQSTEFAAQWVEVSQRRLIDTTARWQRQIADAPDDEPEPTISRQQITDDTTDIFGPDRAESAAVNETTRARHQGSETAIDATVGLSDEDTWFNTGSNVCPICQPLHNTRRPVWAAQFPDGPPTPHTRCKCIIRYANWPRVDRADWDRPKQ